ncbi:MAG: 3-dehydroquinate synthase [Bacilli bacterium]|nr:3-dehydroquinate synthase [Bacilli bacterium]MDD5183386.1 3-dehydroquinate synthase [Bacilli bacterium]
MEIVINSKNNKYNIIFEKAILGHLKDYLNVLEKTLIIYDENIDNVKLNNIVRQFPEVFTYKVKAGESSKSIETFTQILDYLVNKKFSRSDTIIALGGGVIGDLTGFTASVFKRGCKLVMIPTTTMSMMDSAVGSKNALNFSNIKNVVGSFYAPDLVLIDPEVLDSLPRRHYINGMFEALKMGLLLDKKLFNFFEEGIYSKNILEVIERSILAKKKIVEKDEKDFGIRHILNFGHTLGHGIESSYHLDKLLHGESIAIGLIYMIEDKELKNKVKNIIIRMGLDVDTLIANIDKNMLLTYLQNDKKAKNGKIEAVFLENMNKYHIRQVTAEELVDLLGK